MAGMFDNVQQMTARKGPRCSVAVVQEALGVQDAQDFASLVKNREVQAAAISRALREGGYRVPAATLQRHRRGDCNCGA